MTFLDEFMGNKSDKVKLKNFFQKAKNENICESIVENANGEIGLSIWNSALECLSTDEKKIIEIVKEVNCNIYFVTPKLLSWNILGPSEVEPRSVVYASTWRFLLSSLHSTSPMYTQVCC